MCVCAHICMNGWVCICTSLFISIKHSYSRTITGEVCFLHTRGHCVGATCEITCKYIQHISRWFRVKDLPAKVQEMQDSWFKLWIGRSPRMRKWQPLSILPQKSHGQRAWSAKKSYNWQIWDFHTYISTKECLCLEPALGGIMWRDSIRISYIQALSKSWYTARGGESLLRRSYLLITQFVSLKLHP